MPFDQSLLRLSVRLPDFAPVDGSGLRLVMIAPLHPWRPAAEATIREAHGRAAGILPELIVALVDGCDTVLAAAGLGASTGIFEAETRLGAPVPELLAALNAEPVEPGDILELTVPALPEGEIGLRFIRQAAAFCRLLGFDWTLIILPARLRRALQTLDLPVTVLGAAPGLDITAIDVRVRV